jgi:spore maturation protein CgeB
MKKLLYIKMGTHNPNMSFGLAQVFNVVKEIDWCAYNNDLVQLNYDIKYWVNEFQPDIVFMHIQKAGVVSIDTLNYIASKSIVVNWTGDVRDPIPQWMLETAEHINLTLFSNFNDVHTCRKLGIKSDFLQVGYDTSKFTLPTQNKTISYDTDIVFMGSHYKNVFPLSDLREKMVLQLKEIYGNRFKVYGSGWNKNITSGIIENFATECNIYHRAKIAINLSHFNYLQYSSDRLFRIMGSGAFCLSHNYLGIEKDFESGKDLAIWNNIDELIEKIEYYLEYALLERNTIAANGNKKVASNFTWVNFAENLLKITNK